MKTQNNIPAATIEVPSVLKECLIALEEVAKKIREYHPQSKVSDCLEEYAFKLDDSVSDAAYQVGEMVRVEVLNGYYYKE